MDPFGLVGGIAGGIMNAAFESAAAEQQYKRNQELQNAQFEFNSKEAEKAHQRALEMNQITYQQNSIQNKVRQMKEAGLNPALMYGGGAGNAGGSGSASTGAQASGAIGAGAQKADYAASMGIAMQLAQVQSQIELNKANANLANTQASKTGGVDTEAQSLENEFKAIRNSIASATGEEQIKQAEQQTIRLTAEAGEAIARKNITTIEEANAAGIQAAKIALLNAEAAAKSAEAELSNERRNNIAVEMMIAWANAKTNQKNATTAENRLNWDKELWGKEVEQRNQDRTNRLWVAGINAGGQVLGDVLNTIAKIKTAGMSGGKEITPPITGKHSETKTWREGKETTTIYDEWIERAAEEMSK